MKKYLILSSILLIIGIILTYFGCDINNDGYCVYYKRFNGVIDDIFAHDTICYDYINQKLGLCHLYIIHAKNKIHDCSIQLKNNDKYHIGEKVNWLINKGICVESSLHKKILLFGIFTIISSTIFLLYFIILICRKRNNSFNTEQTNYGTYV